LEERNALENNGFDAWNITLLNPVPEEVDVLAIADPKIAYSEIEIGPLNEYIQMGAILLSQVSLESWIL